MQDDLQSVDQKTGAAPDSRLKSLTAALNVYADLRRLDETASRERAKTTAMFDNQPPYSEKVLRDKGQSFRCNLNFGQAEGLLEESLAAYVDLLDSTENLLTVKIRLDADPHTKRQYEEVLSNEISKMLRQWPGFVHRHLLCTTYFTKDGIAVAYFPDKITWKWEVARQGEALFPRKTRTEESAIPVMALVHDYEPYDLHAFIRDEEAATIKGWNVEAVKQTILRAKSQGTTPRSQDWEAWQASCREFDLQTGVQAKPIRVVHMFVREFSGEISHFIFEEPGNSLKPGQEIKLEPGQAFLYQGLREYASADEWLALYCFGVGTTGHLQSVRGLGYKIFPQIQVLNRVRSQLVDGAMLSSSLLLRPTDSAALRTTALTYYGPYAVINPGMRVEDIRPPNFSNNAIPVVSDMTEMIRTRKAGYTPMNALPSGQREMTKGEVSAILDNAKSLSAVSQLLFYNPEDRKYRAAVKRMIWKAYPAELDGGPELQALKRRIQERGVPLEAFYAIIPEETRSVRALGGGSPAHRDAILRELTDLSPAFDTVGRRRLIRVRVASRVGWDRVDEFIEAPTEERATIDEQFAFLENAILERGDQVPVLPNQLHLEHLKAHMQAIGELIQAEQQGAPLEQIVTKLSPLHQHAVQHVESAQGDPTSEEDLANYRQALQQTGEIIINGARRLAKLRREQGAQEGQQGQDGQGELNDEMQRTAIEFNLKLQMLKEKADVENQIRVQRAQTDTAIADAKAAADMRRKAGLSAEPV